MTTIGEGISGALFEDDAVRKYRYALWRIWDQDKPGALLVGLNPSLASQFKNDRTIVREIDFCKRWGYGALFKANLHPYVTPYPKELWANVSQEQNELNDDVIKQLFKMTAISVVCWGNEGAHAGTRPDEVLSILTAGGVAVRCLGVNPSGEPKHPLYLPKTTQLMQYVRSVKSDH